MERLGMAARVAQLQMSATEDDQVRQRQDAVGARSATLVCGSLPSSNFKFGF